jgi:hypothetical protein
MQSTRYSCHILVKLEFSRQIFEKSYNIKFNENPSSGTRMDRHDEDYSRFSQFFEHAYKI